MSACPSWCEVTHENNSGLHQRLWLLDHPVGVSLVLDGEPGAAVRGPQVIISARVAAAKGRYGALLALGNAAALAEVFRVLGHADVADAIGEAVSTAKGAER